MTHRWFFRLLVLLLAFASPALAQGDDVRYLPDSQTLLYTMNYDQLAALAEAGGCSQEAFENSLLHSVVRHLFLFLPFEASYHPEAVTLAVEVVGNGVSNGVGNDETGRRAPLLRVSGELEQLRATNSRFRAFMNGFASVRSGYCFTVEADTLKLWLEVLTTRGATIAVADGALAMEIPQATALELVAEQPPTPAAANAVPQESAAERVESPAANPAAVATVAAAPTPERYLPAGFQATPYLSDLRVRTFRAPAAVLEPDTDYAAVILTSKGRLVIDLLEDEAPQTVNNFVFLARHHFYDGVVFHRVLPDFMAQTGDPSGTGLGGPGYWFADEISSALSHHGAGVVSMANAGPDSNGSQFFITLAPTPWLDGSYTIFGAVREGLEVLAQLQQVDPIAPLAVVGLDVSLGTLAAQGVDLGGPAEESVASYLERRLGRLPTPGERVQLEVAGSAGFDAVIGVSEQSDEPMIGFWPPADRIEALYIVQRPK